MGSLTSTVLAAGIMAVAASTTARAADLFLPPPPLPEPVEVFGGGWYLRGDVGVGITDFRKTVATDASTPSVPYIYNTVEDRLSDTVFVGAGVGYQFNSWFRVDVTGEYRNKTDWRFASNDVSFGPSNLYNIDTGHFSSVVGLVNASIDIGTWWGITPFVTGGVGFAHHMFGTVTDIGALGATGGYGLGGGKDKTNFAWALGAGLAYDVTPNFKVELAYRYLNQGDAQTGILNCLPVSSCGLKTTYKLKEIESHDIKIGMRWLLAAPVAYEPPPLITKY